MYRRQFLTICCALYSLDWCFHLFTIVYNGYSQKNKWICPSNKSFEFQLHSSKIFCAVFCVRVKLIFPKENPFREIWKLALFQFGIILWTYKVWHIARATAWKFHSNWMVTKKKENKCVGIKEHTKNDQLPLNGQFKSDATKEDRKSVV